MKQSELFHQIESYVRNKMSEQDRLLFEQQIANDPSLADKVHQHQEEQKILELIVEDDLREKMEQWDSTTPSVESNQLKKWIPFIVSLLLLIIAGTCLWYLFNKNTIHNNNINTDSIHKEKEEENPQSKDPKLKNKIKEEKQSEKLVPTKKKSIAKKPKKETTIKTEKKNIEPVVNSNLIALAEEYFIPYQPQMNSNRSTLPSSEKDDISKAMLLFNQKNYEDGNQILKKLQSKKPNNLTIKYHLASGLYSNKNYNNAITYLDILNQESDFLYSEKTDWMLVLSYIFTQQDSNAKEIINKIVKDKEHEYYKQAKSMLNNF